MKTWHQSWPKICVKMMLLATSAMLAVACGNAGDTASDREAASEPTETTAPDVEAAPRDDISVATSTSADPESATPGDSESSAAAPPSTISAPPAVFSEGAAIPDFPQGNDAIARRISNMSLSVSDGKAVFDILDGAGPTYDAVTYLCISSDGCGIDDQLVTRGTIVVVSHANSDEVAAADEAHSKALDDYFAADSDEASAAADQIRTAARKVLAEALYAEALRIRDNQTAPG